MLVDDEPLVLKDLKENIEKVRPEAETVSFTAAGSVLAWLKENQADVVFLDIELGSDTGLEVAEKIREMQPDCKIIFVTGYEQYAVQAFRCHVEGYLLKPVFEEDMKRELDYWFGTPKKQVRIQTFGGFGVFVDEEPVRFRRAKAKELLACLVDRRGVDITVREACNLLFEDGVYNTIRKNYFQSIYSSLKQTLRQAGIEDILVKGYNSFSIDVSKVECDMYQLLEGDEKAKNSYRRDYLLCYSWAETTSAALDQKIREEWDETGKSG